MPRKEYALFGEAEDDAEALGVLYAESVGLAYPIAPARYSQGRQPDGSGHYHVYWVPPLPAVGVTPLTPQALPVRLELDSFSVAQDGRSVELKSKPKVVRLKFTTGT